MTSNEEPSLRNTPTTHRALDDGSQLVFVSGVPRSGTSWVERILNSHPDAYCRLIDHSQEALRGLRVFVSRYNRLLHKLARDNDNRTVYGSSTDDLHALTKTFYLTIAQRHLNGLGKDRPVRIVGFRDHTVSNLFGLFAHLFPRAAFVYLLRDPRDVAISSWYDRLRLDNTFEAKAGNLQYYARVMAREWVRSYNAIFHHGLSEKVRWHTVRYEDLANNFAPTTEALFRFLDLSSVDSLVRTAEQETNFQTLTGRVPGAASNISHLRQGRPDAWKTELSPRTLEIITAVAGRYIRQHGYEDTGELVRSSRFLRPDGTDSPLAVRQRFEGILSQKQHPWTGIRGDQPHAQLDSSTQPVSGVQRRYKELLARSDARVENARRDRALVSEPDDTLVPKPYRSTRDHRRTTLHH